MKYLIRFFKEEEYARQFLSGDLRLQRLGYYKYCCEGGRGDIDEGTISRDEAGLLERLVLCMFLFETDSSNPDPTICVSRNVLDDFCEDGGYAVVFPFDSFCSYMERYDPEIIHGPIVYCDDLQTLTGEIEKCVFRKDRSYRHQSEYRFLFSDFPNTFWVNTPDETTEQQKPVLGQEKFSDPNVLHLDAYTGAVYVCKLPPVSEVHEDTYQLDLHVDVNS